MEIIGVVAAERRNRLALVELDRVPLDPVFAHEIAEHAGMLDLDMLKDEELHRRFLREGGAAARTGRAAEGQLRGRFALNHSRAAR